MVIVGVAATAVPSTADDGRRVRASLTGYQEVPAVSTTGNGSFRARLKGDGTIDWTLSYRALEADATQAHIHFAQEDVNGGISVWLCSNLPSPPTPTTVDIADCPLREGTVSGTITASHVFGPAAQGIGPSELAELLAAIRAGVTYANVHTTMFPGGEIRAPLD
jgi:hypothetical protein